MKCFASKMSEAAFRCDIRSHSDVVAANTEDFSRYTVGCLTREMFVCLLSFLVFFFYQFFAVICTCMS